MLYSRRNAFCGERGSPFLHEFLPQISGQLPDPLDGNRRSPDATLRVPSKIVPQFRCSCGWSCWLTSWPVVISQASENMVPTIPRDYHPIVLWKLLFWLLSWLNDGQSWSIMVNNGLYIYRITGWWWLGTMEFGVTFHRLGIIIPTGFHIVQRGRYTTNQYLYVFVC